MGFDMPGGHVCCCSMVSKIFGDSNGSKKGFIEYHELTIPTKVRTVAKQFSQTFLGQNEPFWGKKRLKNSYFESYLWISTCCVGPNAVAVWL